MTEPVRFPAQVPYEKWPSLYGVFTAMEAGDFALAQQRWDADKQNCLDSAGAIQSWYLKFTPATPKATEPPAIGFETLPWFESPDGQVNVTVITVENGKTTCSAGSGNVQCWISLDPSFPDDPTKTAYGSGMAGYIYPAKDAPVYFKQVGYAVQQMRLSTEPNT
jgi:hypothetical protein